MVINSHGTLKKNKVEKFFKFLNGKENNYLRLIKYLFEMKI